MIRCCVQDHKPEAVSAALRPSKKSRHSRALLTSRDGESLSSSFRRSETVDVNARHVPHICPHASSLLRIFISFVPVEVSPPRRDRSIERLGRGALVDDGAQNETVRSGRAKFGKSAGRPKRRGARGTRTRTRATWNSRRAHGRNVKARLLLLDEFPRCFLCNDFAGTVDLCVGGGARKPCVSALEVAKKQLPANGQATHARAQCLCPSLRAISANARSNPFR